MAESATNVLPYGHWHVNAGDNLVSTSANFKLASDALPGCYTFSLAGASRAFNPAGGDPSDPQSKDWYYDATWLNWGSNSQTVAVVDI